MDSRTQLSEDAANVVENLACQIAERQGGRIVAPHLVPYLPMSLELIASCLDEMVDNTSVFSEDEDGKTVYEFSNYREKPAEEGALEPDVCVSCSGELLEGSAEVVCERCAGALRRELNRLAESMGWPAQAVYEHEIFYLAANHDVPHYAETLAGHSRYTLRSMRRKLARLTSDGYIRQDLDTEKGSISYTFPGLAYSRRRYRENMGIVRSYPASVMEEVELKLVRIFFTLALMLAGVLLLAFMHVPFPLLIGGYLVAGAIVSLGIWRHKSEPLEG